MRQAVLMLAPPTSARPPMPPPVAFRCEATAHDLSGTREVLLATYRGRSPRLATRWLRAQAYRLARLLSPDPEAVFLQDTSLVTTQPDVPRPDGELRAWADNDQAYEHALRALATGRAFVFTVTDYDARYSLRVYPLPTRRPALPQAPVPSGCPPHSSTGKGRHRRPRGRRTP
ncbi:hypothetical protein [Streptomyces sp. NPDC057623]|uniref:hypothetical protein n=1 Tax=Streptomyces sp. NPDC057623 TaxID=3346187 RepID=UPI00368EF310